MASQYRHASGPDSQDAIHDEDRLASVSVENMVTSIPDSGPEIDVRIRQDGCIRVANSKDRAIAMMIPHLEN